MDDAKKISRKLATKYAGITDVVQAPEPAPLPESRRESSPWSDTRPPARSYSSSPGVGRSPYVRDRWSSKPLANSIDKYAKPAEQTIPVGRKKTDRPPYEDRDVDWELARTIKLDRAVTWVHFVHMMGLECPLYPDHDVEIFDKLRELFLTRKDGLYNK